MTRGVAQSCGVPTCHIGRDAVWGTLDAAQYAQAGHLLRLRQACHRVALPGDAVHPLRCLELGQRVHHLMLAPLAIDLEQGESGRRGAGGAQVLPTIERERREIGTTGLCGRRHCARHGRLERE